MKIQNGNFWDIYKEYDIAIITTNGTITKRKQGVMGAGIAKQATYRFPFIKSTLAKAIMKNGNIVNKLIYNLYAFPVKHNWFEKADIDLIEKSCIELLKIVNDNNYKSILLVKPGCGNGQLHYEDVEPLMNKYFDDRFTLIDNAIYIKKPYESRFR